MSNSQTPQVKLKLLTVLAENSGNWLSKSTLAFKSRTHAERIQNTLDSFERQKFIKSQDWGSLSKKEQEEIISKNGPVEIKHTTKMIYHIDELGWGTIKRSLQDCFENENVLELLNIPEDIKKKLS